MRSFKKYLPWVLAAVAIIGLIIQYKNYTENKERCGCSEEKQYSALV